MKKITKVWSFYIWMLLIFGGLIYAVVVKGDLLGSAPGFSQNHIVGNGEGGFLSTFIKNIAEPGGILLLQMIAILLVARFFGQLFARFGQPTVVGEILAGIILGPSVLGKYFPDAFNFIFSTTSLGSINVLSQIGLILFMFVIGMELNIGALKGKMKEVLVISHAGIIIPFFLGLLLAYFIYIEFASALTGFLPFALFVGISMSITAFPVLARIIQEKDLTRSHLGTMSLAIAAIGDVTAWCLLAAVIAVSGSGNVLDSVVTIFFTMAYVAVMMFVVKPFLRKVGEVYKTNELVNKKMVAFIFLLLLISSFTTQVLGIHALFGAFMAGVVMPPLTNFRKIITEKIEDVSVSLLLPLFFVFIGLRTEIGLVNTPHLWLICGLIILVAIVGKFGGTAIVSKLLGETWRDSVIMGVLMNTRGLMELIVLNIGYEMGILPPVVFVMLVIMTLVTTFMTTPVMSLIEKILPARNRRDELVERQSLGIFKALVAVGNPDNGKPLLNVAKSVLDGFKNTLNVTVLHITVGTDLNPFSEDEFNEESFKGVKAEALSLNIPIETEYKVTDNIGKEIVDTTNDEEYDFLLVGAGAAISKDPGRKRSILNRIPVIGRILRALNNDTSVIYPGTLIKDKTKMFVESCHCSVGVFVNRGFTGVTKVMILLNEENDVFLLRYGRRVLRNKPSVRIRIMDMNGLANSSKVIAQALVNLMTEFPDSVKIASSSMNNQHYMKDFSLMLISYQSWNRLCTLDNSDFENVPSALIINKKRSRFHSDASDNGEE